MNKDKIINLTTLGKNNVGILLSSKEEIMKAYQEQMPIMTYILKEKNPQKPPKYFVDFAKKQGSFNKYFSNFAKQMLEFVKEQKQFNKVIIQRLDKIDSRIDNIVKKNNLVE